MTYKSIIHFDRTEEDVIDPSTTLIAPLSFSEEAKLELSKGFNYTTSKSIYDVLAYRGYAIDQQEELQQMVQGFDKHNVDTKVTSEVLKKQSELGRSLTPEEINDIRTGIEDNYLKELEERPNIIPKVKLDENQWKKSDYYREGLDFSRMSDNDGLVTEDLAQLLAERHDEEKHLRERLSAPRTGFLKSHNTIRSILTGVIPFAVQAIDPLNIALAFIPIVGEMGEARLAARLGEFGSTIAKGAIEGAGGMSLIEPFLYESRNKYQFNYTAGDAATSVLFGAILGAGVHSISGFINGEIRPGSAKRSELYDIYESSKKAEAVATAQLDSNQPVNVKPIIDAAKIDYENTDRIRVSPFDEYVPEKRFESPEIKNAKKVFEENTKKYELWDRNGDVIRDLETRKEIIRNRINQRIDNELEADKLLIENLERDINELKQINNYSKTIKEIDTDDSLPDSIFNNMVKEEAQNIENLGGIYIKSLRNSGFTLEEIQELNRIKPNIVNHGGRGVTLNAVDKHHNKTMFGDAKKLIRELLNAPKKEVPNTYKHEPIEIKLEKKLERAKKKFRNKEKNSKLKADKEYNEAVSKETVYIEAPKDGYGKVKSDNGTEIVNEDERNKKIIEDIDKEWRTFNKPNPGDLVDNRQKIRILHDQQEKLGLTDDERNRYIEAIIKDSNGEATKVDEAILKDLQLKYKDFFLTDEAKARRSEEIARIKMQVIESMKEMADRMEARKNNVVVEKKDYKFYNDKDNLHTIEEDIQKTEEALFNDPETDQSLVQEIKEARKQVYDNMNTLKEIKDDIIDCALLIAEEV